MGIKRRYREYTEGLTSQKLEVLLCGGVVAIPALLLIEPGGAGILTGADGVEEGAEV